MKYDAFISYRHLKKDAFVAENLHKVLESFSLPKNIVSPTGKTKITRVFRDKDELPLSSNLSDPIEEALKESEYLIVICSKELKESKWCMKEIDTFISLHGREKVFAVLIEGEPHESFPPQLLSEDIKTIDADGNESIINKAVEPLAADVRGNTDKEVRKKIKEESLRLLAPIFKLGYDDLRQRHRERKLKQIALISSIASSAFLIFAITATLMALKIKSQAEIVSKNYAVTLANNAISSLNKGRLNEALIEMAESRAQMESPNLMLAESIVSGKYAPVDSLVINNEFTIDGLSYMLLSSDGRYLVSGQAYSNLTVFDTTSHEKISNLTISVSDFSKDYALFVDDCNLLYNSYDGVHILNLTTFEDQLLHDTESKIFLSDNGETITLIGQDSISIFTLDLDDKQNNNSLQSLTEVSTYALPGIGVSELYYYNPANGYYCECVSLENSNACEINIFDTQIGKSLSSLKVDITPVQLVLDKDYLFYQGMPDTAINLYNSACISIHCGEKVWEENNQSSRYTIASCDKTANGAPLLILTTARDVQSIEFTTGKILNICPLSYSPVGLEKKPASSEYFLPLSSGNVLNYNTESFEILEEFTFAYPPEIVANQVILSSNGSLFLSIIGNDTVTEYVKRKALADEKSLLISDLDNRSDLYLLPSNSMDNFGGKLAPFIPDGEESSIYIASNTGKLGAFISYMSNTLRIYDFEDMGKLVCEKEIDPSRMYLPFFSAFDDYFVVSLLSGGADIYSLKDMSLVHSLPAKYSYISGFAADSSLDRYLVDCMNTSYVLDSNFEEIGYINRQQNFECIGFDNTNNKILLRSGNSAFYVN